MSVDLLADFFNPPGISIIPVVLNSSFLMEGTFIVRFLSAFNINSFNIKQ